MNHDKGRKSMGRDSKNIGHASGRVAPNLGNGWISMFSAQARAQMEWIFRRKWSFGNPRREILLQPDGRYNIEGGRFYKGAARRRALLCLQRELRRFRDILSGTPIRRYSTNRRGREGNSIVNSQLQIITQDIFIELLTERITKNNMTYVDAIVDICEKTGVEFESIPKLLNPKIRKMILHEALRMNLLKRKNARLPI